MKRLCPSYRLVPLAASLFSMFSGCSHNRLLRESLTQAGSNRPELERVLEH